MKGFSDLNINGNNPVRVQPESDEWGPKRVPSVSQKKRARALGVVATIFSATAVGLAMKFFFDILMLG